MRAIQVGVGGFGERWIEVLSAADGRLSETHGRDNLRSMEMVKSVESAETGEKVLFET